MATLNELTYNLLNTIRGGRLSDDELISQRQIAFMYGYYRAKLIREDYEKKRPINPNLIQDLGCIPVQLVDSAECCEIETDCYILRTVDKMPTPIEFYKNNGLFYVGSINKKHSFQRTFPYESRWISCSKYTGKLPRYYELNSYIYIPISNDDLKNLEYINVHGVFEDPIEAFEFKACNDDACKDWWNETYPLPSHMIPIINQLILTNELRIESTSLTDQINDAKQQGKQ